MTRPTRIGWFVAGLALALVAAACSSDSAPGAAPQSTASPTATAVDETPTPTATATPSPTATATPTTPPFVVASPEFEGPVAGPNEPELPAPVIPLPDGYVVEEYFVGGEATRFIPVGEAGTDGFWSAEPAGKADYRTRILVHKPPPERFSGVVLVEWLNETGIASGGLAWSYLSELVGRSGHVYVVASVQARDVIGGIDLLDTQAGSPDAADTGEPEEDGGLVASDPERYGSLEHPGDEYAYDIHSQIGLALRENSEQVFGEVPLETVAALGYSQSAAYISTYYNAIHQLAEVYDGFMVHGRGASVAPVEGNFGEAVTGAEADFASDGVDLRTDLEEPVFIFQTETDLTLLGYAGARQPDADTVRTWEIAGAAHVDDTVVRALVGGPRNPAVGELVGCTEPVNVGPHRETYQAAVAALISWAQGGEPPPQGERLEITESENGFPTVVRDELGTALGGIRNPLVDVPVFVLSGEPATPISVETTQENFDVCNLFGTTRGLDAATLAAMYGSAEEYLAAFDEAATAATSSGYLLPADADSLRTEAVTYFVPLFG